MPDSGSFHRPHRAHRDEGLAPGMRRLLHLDIDAFLASVEQAAHPELHGKPVVVGGMPHERNLVMSCSYEARAFGVRPGMLLAVAKRRCPRAIFRRGDAAHAGRLRGEVARILLRFTPAVEIASIDDFFVDLTGTARLHGAACDAAAAIRHAVRAEVDLPLSSGVGTNRMLARLAGKLAKPGGVGELLPGGEEAFLANLPVRELPGVGHSIGAALERFSIRTVGELRLVAREVLFASFGRDGLVLFERARGRDDATVQTNCALDEAGALVLSPPRSIHRETTFEPEEGRRELVEGMLAYLLERAAYKLRGAGCSARTLEVHLCYVDTRPRAGEGDGGQEGGLHAARRTFAAPTDSTDELWETARALLSGLPRRRALVKRIGLVLSSLAPSAGWQGRLFSAPGRDRFVSHADRQRRLDRALDRLRGSLGFGRVLRGACLPLRAIHPLSAEGFQLRTPSLTQ